MHWTLKNKPDPEIAEQLTTSLGIHPVLSTILAQRGIENFDMAKHFFRPSLGDIHDPFLMKDMDLAIERIEVAIQQKENVLIYGDYDVDGTTAVSLVFSYLRSMYDNVAYYIPDRYEEGYGISYKGIDFAHDNDMNLIIALDCGIKALDKVAYATEKGIDFIICDHHRPGEIIPKAVAVLDPKRNDCTYPYDELCGCGIGFKLIQALNHKANNSINTILPYLDLVATAIAADIVPLTGENRVLSYYGLKVINSDPRPGIKALIHQIKKETLTITDVVFIIAPRINAAGRMKHGSFAVELLSEQNPDKALEFAKAIELYNSDRKDLDKKITEEALDQIKENQEELDFSTVVYNPDWHKGVIGIVASRLIEQYYRPTLVFTKSGTKLAASARSVKGFDVYNALHQCSDLIEQFGGHKYAAGLTLDPNNYKPFKEKFEQVIKETLPEESRERQLAIDAEISLSEIDEKFYRILKQMGPFGPLNMKPVFVARGLRDNGYGKKIGADNKHLKLQIISGTDQKTYHSIGFGLGEKYDQITAGNSFKAAFTIEENHWNGITSLQLNLKDIKTED
ncbi:single-stranded-DNA-specific exonuclease RecJ [Lutimonas sp.]|uniref:single-stranded-DNA-specific exonuclease RecJ n=1 Tax=Lutimonas sp. TaxID=1872403 RepID=UPI003D9BBA97